MSFRACRPRVAKALAVAQKSNFQLALDFSMHKFRVQNLFSPLRSSFSEASRNDKPDILENKIKKRMLIC